VIGTGQGPCISLGACGAGDAGYMYFGDTLMPTLGNGKLDSFNVGWLLGAMAGVSVALICIEVDES